MNYILFDGETREHLLPFTYTRPVADIRIGILTIREKWEKHLGEKTSTLTEKYLAEKFPCTISDENILIKASVLPSAALLKAIKAIKIGEALFYKDEVLAYYSINAHKSLDLNKCKRLVYNGDLVQLKNSWDIFVLNPDEIKVDFELLTKNRKSAPIPHTVQCLHKENIFLENGVDINFAILNASDGPIYLGKDAIVMEGCMIRGPFSLGDDSILKMGAKIYGGTTIGPMSKIGGEVNNSVIFGYSSKAHEGYLGNAVIGEWCNLGADTNNSNLKNNYAEVRLWTYTTESFAKTGLQFCGMMMGDHSKCGINTMFNTGTVVGVCTNIFGANFPRNFIPSFSWGGSSGYSVFKMNKVDEMITAVMKRKHLTYSEMDRKILQHIYDISSKYRNF